MIDAEKTCALPSEECTIKCSSSSLSSSFVLPSCPRRDCALVGCYGFLRLVVCQNEAVSTCTNTTHFRNILSLCIRVGKEWDSRVPMTRRRRPRGPVEFKRQASVLCPSLRPAETSAAAVAGNSAFWGKQARAAALAITSVRPCRWLFAICTSLADQRVRPLRDAANSDSVRRRLVVAQPRTPRATSRDGSCSTPRGCLT